jgi:hypothetical protein
LHIQNGGSKRIWILTYSWTGNFLLAWAGQFAGIKNRLNQYFIRFSISYVKNVLKVLLKLVSKISFANLACTYWYRLENFKKKRRNEPKN